MKCFYLFALFFGNVCSVVTPISFSYDTYYSSEDIKHSTFIFLTTRYTVVLEPPIELHCDPFSPYRHAVNLEPNPDSGPWATDCGCSISRVNIESTEPQ